MNLDLIMLRANMDDIRLICPSAMLTAFSSFLEI